MLRTALRKTRAGNIRFVRASAQATGLAAHSADIVCAASSIHWMEPGPTIAEVARILNDEGLFAFFGPSYPPLSPFLRVDRSHVDLVRALAALDDAGPRPARWTWADHLACIQERGEFTVGRAFHIHQEVAWDATAYLDWLKTTNSLQTLLDKGHPGVVREYGRHAELVTRLFGARRHPCLFVYGVHVFARQGGDL